MSDARVEEAPVRPGPGDGRAGGLARVLRTGDGRPRPWPGVAGFALLGLLATQATGLLGRYQMDVLTTLLAFVAIAQAWNILAGFGGQISLGASAFVGTGAYAAAITQVRAGVGYPVALLVALVAGAALALLLAVPLLRLRGDYFAIGTLAAALTIQAWALNWSFAGGSTGLSLPIGALPAPAEVFQIACLVAALAMMTAYAVANSKFGLRLRAVRDDEDAAVGLGVSAYRHRLGALVLSGAISGLAGALIAMQQVSFEPGGMLGIGWTVNALLMTIVGGIGTVLGPAVGAVVVYYALTRQLAEYQTLSLLIEGLLLIAIVRFAPRGLWPLLLAAAGRMTGGGGRR